MKRGRTMNLYGAFGTAAKARAKQRRVKDSFIRKRKVRGKTRWILLKARVEAALQE